ncbi:MULTISPECIES: response regulator transcription factor [Cupriavidus]|uniref:Two component transcriptional regulator, LuxR family n=1 Tax=Cupriavidus taiwanensis TaxID=164546 RepID=A0A375D9Y6_9BURK|nr:MULTISPECIES: response regulator transcription factor [Cupriavidus]MEC3769487.1 response regulator transcription factor [Cupriavidus sp. SS-3]SOY97274.1 putative transcriptional regulator, signal receiver N-trem domain,LuxR C-term domain [Cupriavidus taiwanensis]SOY99995.1 putative transcriptional regulator, signal receiver N-trem domain,LuxR C-term domain [Cupriavidus taiwanensis]SPA56791.1 putative transcriptional regulator, signal receiver N-trem domain,LuxR C-term domain [Cupriavidus tai
MNDQVLRVALADDHPLVVAALRDCLQRSARVQISAECRNGTELLGTLARHPADIAITDFCMGQGDASLDGFNLLSRLARRHPATRVVVISARSNAAIVRRAMKLGVRGFVSKEDPLEEVVRACAHAAFGRGCFCSPAVHAVLQRAALPGTPAREPTQRELEVIRLYAQGAQLTEIAAKLGRSVSTISSQKTVAMRKLGVQTNTGLIRYAYESGLI